MSKELDEIKARHSAIVAGSAEAEWAGPAQQWVPFRTHYRRRHG